MNIDTKNYQKYAHLNGINFKVKFQKANSAKKVTNEVTKLNIPTKRVPRLKFQNYGGPRPAAVLQNLKSSL